MTVRRAEERLIVSVSLIFFFLERLGKTVERLDTGGCESFVEVAPFFVWRDTTIASVLLVRVGEVAD